jgi:hypothetical protein
MRHWLSIPGCICHSPASALDCYDVGIAQGDSGVHDPARIHHAAWRRGGNEHFATCGACLEAPEVERGSRYSALRMTAKGQRTNPLRVSALRAKPVAAME